MEELLASLSANPILACDFVPHLRPYANHHLKFELKVLPRYPEHTAHPQSP